MSKVEFNAIIPVPIKFGSSSVVSVEELLEFIDEANAAVETAKSLSRKVPKGFTNKHVGIVIPYRDSNQFKVIVTAEEPKEETEEKGDGVEEAAPLGSGLTSLALRFPVGTRVSYNGRQGSVIGYRLSRFDKNEWWLLCDQAGRELSSFMADPNKAARI